ncbi:hypothetical protein RTG_02670 [Rhodotorula toruloides ATCC 204091]|uniref:Uncharacterized protein n=1 Tax=Rhodotorula toruloides TaxID=5286 RepID=A0A0K3CQ23_RHOTO|nr:hypothetical protein RTG_02670 [Rhodotorula toruloides ATCC 204091]KAK4330521.1 hypothetical protein RTBOTA2_006196 [Rhodotorula toruloides]PRQ71203.1 hypothetical protein AAT19DRAFT_10743 [Rhodotorula toruloides]
MVKATATLFFGVFVSLRSLVCAARAWRSSDIWTVDWICEKKAGGSFATGESEGRTTCDDLPVEIWQMIKRELLLQAYDRLVARFVSFHHERGRLNGDEDGHLGGDITLKHLDTCPCCWEGLDYDWPDLMHVLEQTRDVIATLLASFDLKLTNSDRFHNPDQQSFSGSCAITIPLLTNRPDAQPTPTSIAQSTYYRCYRGRVNDTMVLDSSLLDVPEDLTKRFNRLFQTFPKLECDQTPLDSIYLGGQIAQQVPDSSSPRWHLAASVIEE